MVERHHRRTALQQFCLLSNGRPGESSLTFNYELAEHGFHVHRIFIIDAFVWPRTAPTPSTELLHWIQNQRLRGVEVSLVRMTDLEDEPGLLVDMGIYRTDAVGWQQTDLEGRTVKYERLDGQCALPPSRFSAGCLSRVGV